MITFFSLKVYLHARLQLQTYLQVGDAVASVKAQTAQTLVKL